jgi:hypothetical protein
VRQYRTLKWLKGGRQDPSSQGSINRAEAIRAWAIQAQEQLKERWAQIIHEDHEMVSRLDIRLPNGLILGVEGDPNRSWRHGPEPETVMMAKLRQAISTTDWGAVVALYGKPPTVLPQAPAQEQPIDLAMAQAQAAAATPRKPRVAAQGQAAVSPGQALLGGLMGNSPQPA